MKSSDEHPHLRPIDYNWRCFQHRTRIRALRNEQGSALHALMEKPLCFYTAQIKNIEHCAKHSPFHLSLLLRIPQRHHNSSPWSESAVGAACWSRARFRAPKCASFRGTPDTALVGRAPPA